MLCTQALRILPGAALDTGRHDRRRAAGGRRQDISAGPARTARFSARAAGSGNPAPACHCRAADSLRRCPDRAGRLGGGDGRPARPNRRHAGRCRPARRGARGRPATRRGHRATRYPPGQFHDRRTALPGRWTGPASAPRRALSARRARRNLARWLAQYPPGIDRRTGELLSLYRTTRWDRGRVGSADGFRNQIAHERRHRERRHVAKSLRSCSAYLATRTFRAFSVIDRRDDTPALRSWLAAPDAPFQNPQADWLKRGNSASVVRLQLDGQALVVKRYNFKGFGHWLRRFWRPSRALAQLAQRPPSAPVGSAHAPPGGPA